MRDRRGELTWGNSLSRFGKTELALLATLLLSAMLFGGSSRYDVMQNVLMQPIAWLVAGVALVVASGRRLHALRWPLGMLAALFLITLLQLVPLGEGLWTSLPGRQPLADVADAIGSQGARPVSMVPSRTLNALSAIGMPLAALLVMAALGRRSVFLLLCAIVVLALANALLAIFQVASGYAEAGYFYSITNTGMTVGIFANRNQSAVFAALAMLIIAFMVTRKERERLPGADILLWSIYGTIFLTILVNGSRSGLLTAGIALAATAVLIHGGRSQAGSGKRMAAQPAGPMRFLPVAVILAFAAGLVAVFLLADRLTAFQRIVGTNPLEDLRFRVVPVLIEMMGRYFPVGSGFGTFEDVYRIHETADLLSPQYLNMAHNDWFQWIIEGGLPGAMLLAVFLGWFALQVRRLGGVGRDHLVFAVAGFAILAIASYFDYPLRTPLFQVVGVWFISSLALLGRPAEAKRGESSPVAGPRPAMETGRGAR
ncbi:O-antigen ligase family protein [Aurantiacibacter hainanensis]|uniref:O-antigen ligase family protein n=1 Tax=Aurantiacibacter hainanensis TaxID=3076114 RepID=UPI0030C70590